MSADLAVLINNPDAIERAADPAEFIIQACERAKAWLREVLDCGDIAQIVEIKSQAEAIRVYTMQKQLGKDAELSAAEIVRRAERGIGVAIRRGQENREIETTSEARARAGRKGSGNQNDKTVLIKPRPTDFASSDELSGNQAGIWHMTDGVSDEDFEAALGHARAQENLSRANLIRKLRDIGSPVTPAGRRQKIGEMAADNYSSRQIAKHVGVSAEHVRQLARDYAIDIPADELFARARIHDSNRIVRETVQALEGLAMGVELIEFDDLDEDEIANWTASLTNSIRALNRLNKKMREIAQ